MIERHCCRAHVSCQPQIELGQAGVRYKGLRTFAARAPFADKETEPHARACPTSPFTSHPTPRRLVWCPHTLSNPNRWQMWPSMEHVPCCRFSSARSDDRPRRQRTAASKTTARCMQVVVLLPPTPPSLSTCPPPDWLKKLDLSVLLPGGHRVESDFLCFVPPSLDCQAYRRHRPLCYTRQLIITAICLNPVCRCIIEADHR